jgi:TatD DNase family protein
MAKIDPSLRLPPSNHNYTIFNSHCHLNDDEQFEKINELIDEGRKFNVTEFIVVGSNNTFNQRAIKISEKYSNCFPAVGWHPDSWSEYSDEKLIKMIEKVDRPAFIGEIGLDYHYSDLDRKDQQEVFSRQLQLAKKYHLPVSIHTREAFSDTIRILKENDITSGVIHNFNTNYEEARAYLEQGMMLSISGVVTFKNAQSLRDSLKSIPLDRILVETDDPYLTPFPFRGQSNHPAYVYFVLKYLADFLQMDIADLAYKTYKNTEKLIHAK